MARLTAPSQWLPGFDPEPPETPAADIEPALTPLAAAVSELAEVADESTRYVFTGYCPLPAAAA